MKVRADGVLILVAVHDPGVADSLGMKPKKTMIVRDHDTAFGDGEGKVVGIRGARQLCVRRGCHVNALAPQADSNGRMDVLIQMELDRGHHPFPSGAGLEAWRSGSVLARFRGVRRTLRLLSSLFQWPPDG